MYRALLFVTLFFLMGLGYGQSVEGKDGAKPNALLNESSPYLLQHAYNPVDWVPWKEEAFQKAKNEDKLVVISIGYSSCHWCQVMEEESFEDKEVASAMNKNYISIKVDREEHPDVDQFYMNFLGLIGSDQGWPINIIALPDGKPFYGGTYHTKEKWLDILDKIAVIHEQNPSKLDEYANKVTLAMEELNRMEKSEEKSISKEILLEGIENWKKNWDSTFGGDLANEKRMYPSNLIFLMEYGVIAKDSSVLSHVKNTLDHIAKRGLYDHVEGGFFRYTTDSEWKTPHFEKMLYDNAQALGLFSYAYKVFKDPRYKQIVSETFYFLKNEMRGSNGAFISSINADTEGEEGKFYLWTLEELEQVVPEQFDLFSDFYEFTEMEGSKNRNILLTISQNEAGFGERHSLTPEEVHDLTQSWRRQLIHVKAKKARPKVDNKILISWNALLVSGLLDAYKAFGDSEYLEVAQEVMAFIASNGFKNGKLIHSYTDEGTNIGGFIEDYAYFIKASLEFYGVTSDESYLKMATQLTKKVLSEYSDESSGMFKYNSSDKLIIRVIKTNDGVFPSPNAIMANNLFSLGNIYYETDFLDRSQEMLQLMVDSFHTYPEHYAKWGSLFLKNVYPFFEVAVVGPRAMELIQKMFALKEQNMLLLGTKTRSNIPLFEDRYKEDGTYIYVCQNGSCKLPVTTLEAALQQLNVR